jgi:hypothetical protein
MSKVARQLTTIQLCTVSTVFLLPKIACTEYSATAEERIDMIDGAMNLAEAESMVVNLFSGKQRSEPLGNMQRTRRWETYRKLLFDLM